jgi:hypothetical protein
MKGVHMAENTSPQDRDRIRLPGSVYLTPGENGGIFLRPEDSAALVNVIEQVENEPMIAGPELDSTVLRELRQLLSTTGAPVNENEPPTVLSLELAIYLELIFLHAEVKASLAPKLRFKCRDCGLEFTDDPGHLARRQAEAAAQERSATLNDYFRIKNQADAHHRLGAALAAGIALNRPRPSGGSICGRCRGNRFDKWDVTYCPGCGELRHEMVLLRCPDCSYDYRALARGPIWGPNAEAIDDFRIHWKQTAISNAVSSLWASTGPSQIGDLVTEISPLEKLIGVCKYAAINGLRRNVIILFTSEKVVWTVRRLALWSDRYSRAWDQIQKISTTTDGQHELCITPTNGDVVRFSGSQGDGAHLSVDNRPFGPDEIRHATCGILPASR